RRRRRIRMLRDEFVGQVQADAALRRDRAGEDDEQVQAARNLPAPQVAGGGRSPVVRAEPAGGASDRGGRLNGLLGAAARPGSHTLAFADVFDSRGSTTMRVAPLAWPSIIRWACGLK